MLLIANNQLQLPVQAACILARFPCMCKVKFGVLQHVTQMNLHVDVTAMSQIPAFVSRCHSTCMLPSVFCPVPSSCFILIPFSSSDHSSFHQSSQFGAAAAGAWRQQCSVTSGAALQRDLVTSDGFKTSAPHLIGFPEPLSFLCLQP